MMVLSQIIRWVLLCALAGSLGLSSLLANKKYNALLCQHVDVEIKPYPEQSLLTTQELLTLLQTTHNQPLLGTPLKKIDSYRIKNILAIQPLIKKVTVYKTWLGKLKIYLETKCLLARMLSPNDANTMQKYVDEYGNILSIQGVPLLRLLVIGGDPQDIVTTKWQIQDKGLLTLLHSLYADRFFRYQITSLEITPNHTITLGTQIGNHQILFGQAVDICEKLANLQLFYSRVIPYKGWNAYRRINLQFTDQLVCD